MKWHQFLFLLAGIALTGCAADKPDAATSHLCCVKAEAPGAFTDKSIYQTDSSWTNDAGKQMKLGALRGRSQIVAMFFAKCEYACPILVHDMKRIESALPETLRAQTGFVLVSFDTERDTPAALRAYRTQQSLDAARWTLLRGDADNVLELAALLGVKFKQDARGQFAHSNLITVLDSNGEIIHQQVGLNGTVEETVQAIARAAGKP